MQRKHFLGLGLVVFTPLALTAACGGSENQIPPAGSGGETATGGTTGLAGDRGSGGISGSGASGSTGGSSGTGGTPASTGGGPGLGGMGGMGGAPAPAVEVPDFEGEKPCASDKECTSSGKLCNKELRVCVECFEDADCGEDAVCDAGSCQEISSCDNSLACTTDEVCVKEEGEAEGVCQECGSDADCTDGGTCIGGACLSPCESDKECTPDGLLCNGELGACTECVTSSDCGDAEICKGGECHTGICSPGESQCFDNAIVTCLEDGSGYMEPIDCGEATCGLFGNSEAVSCVSKENPSSGGTNLLWEDFSDGAGGWSISAANPSGPPEIRDGRACIEQSGFTLGWPNEGTGIDLEPGTYTFSFTTRTNQGAGVEAKIAAADEPFEPVYFTTQDFDVSERDHHSFTFTLEQGGENVGIAFNVWSNEGRLCFDEISLAVD